MTTSAKTTQITLAARPVGEPDDSTFGTVTTDLPELAEGQVLLRTVYLSLDPYMRGRMSAAKSYAAPWEVGQVMQGATVCEVVESRSDRRKVGDLVLAYSGWQTYAVADARHMRSLDPAAAPVSTALGVLGMPGFTAYAGLLQIGRPSRARPSRWPLPPARSGPRSARSPSSRGPAPSASPAARRSAAP
ncbi:MDR family NADP-dependent oxidoreductase [Nocardioides houyundeii]|uniref:MDR family NADP-dependent oxidoreductase n=1 Tax=Nocardioides houyundeii TaxID=2045452 RepID=UPI001F530D69|nr:NADP-dependent oxidoreductase [Nocardioides houyundeii]